MLILTRKVEQSLMVGNDVRITVLGVNPDESVKVGCNPPLSIDIHRQEVYDRIQHQKKAAGI